ncbi:hypothetical protein ACQUW5_06815 [Legionella sp. CNM-1927-20]|uniref:hypothetical protein n=1 Tax=Legionella sp. CNM-1927-20 TaxID=3422221 RepID=UPI00403AB5AE
MPRFNFFTKIDSKKPISVHFPDSKIQTIISEIEELKRSENSFLLIQLVKQKRTAFLREIHAATDLNKRDKLIRSYLNFAKTLESCLFDNKNAFKYLIKYYTSFDYHLIPLDNNFHKQADPYINNQENNLAVTGTILSLSILVLSGIVLGAGFPVLSLIGLGLAITVLLPSLFYLAVETLPKQIKTFKAEVELFKAAIHTDLSQSELENINPDMREDNMIMVH